LAAGLNADLLLVEGNPLEDIDNTLNIRGVWREGKLCSAYSGNIGAGDFQAEKAPEVTVSTTALEQA
jgi:hypothetical protein